MEFKWYIAHGDLRDLRGEFTTVAELHGKGCLVRTTTLWNDEDMGRTTSEALTFVPGATLEDFGIDPAEQPAREIAA